MNKDNAKDCLPLVQALAEGSTVQYDEYGNGKWVDVENVGFALPAHHYRIKPGNELRWYNCYPDGRKCGGYSSKDKAALMAGHDAEQVAYLEAVE